MIGVRADQMIYRLLPCVEMRLRDKGDAAIVGNRCEYTLDNRNSNC
jgi:hypothetical protein